MATAYYRVTYTEHERGWGASPAGEDYYLERANAEARIAAYNARNTAKAAPDWYMKASGPDLVDQLPPGVVPEDQPKTEKVDDGS